MTTPEIALRYVTEGPGKVLDEMIGFSHMEADCFLISWIHTKFNLVKLKKVYDNWQTGLYGKGWNTPLTDSRLLSFKGWAESLPGQHVGTTIEFPYANVAGHEVTGDSARAFGRDLARALRRYVEGGSMP